MEDPAPYTVLLRHMADGQPMDATELRFAFARSALYSPYGTTVEDMVREAFGLLEAGRAEEALSRSREAIGMCFVCGGAHLAALNACMKLGNVEAARGHAGVARALQSSICPGEDSGTEACPCRVISISEERYYVNMLGHQVTGQGLVFTEQGPLDRLDVLDPETGESYDLYFDVSIPMGWLQQSLEADEEAGAASDSAGKAPE
jgi:hypothetical protein